MHLLLALLLCTLAPALGTKAATTIFHAEFEAPNIGELSISQPTEVSTDDHANFFGESDKMGKIYVTKNKQRLHSFFTKEDVYGDGKASVQTITFPNINIAGFQNLVFNGLVAEQGDYDGWDPADYVHIEYKIDHAPSFHNLIRFESITS